MNSGDPQQALRVLHLTDPHLFAEASGAMRGVVTQQSLRRVIDDYLAGDWQADIALLTGDVSQDDSAGAYERCREELIRLGLPVYCLPGNHDLPALMRAHLDEAPFYYCPVRQHGNWLVICLDSYIEGQAGGAVSDQELERLDRAIADSDAAHVLVSLHHPPVPLGSEWLDSVGLANGDELLTRLQRSGRVRLLVFGHAHQAYDGATGKLSILGTPSTCRQFLPGSDEFALDALPPAWRRITLQPDGRFETELMWLPND